MRGEGEAATRAGGGVARSRALTRVRLAIVIAVGLLLAFAWAGYVLDMRRAHWRGRLPVIVNAPETPEPRRG